MHNILERITCNAQAPANPYFHKLVSWCLTKMAAKTQVPAIATIRRKRNKTEKLWTQNTAD